jgi:hypothetical protein
MSRAPTIVLICLVLVAALASQATAQTPYVVNSGWQPFVTDANQAFAYGGTGGVVDLSNMSPSIPADPFTFTLPEPGVLKVTDVFKKGDYFGVWDNGSFVGQTPAVPLAGGGTADPNTAYGMAGVSYGAFNLAPGSHSLQFQNLLLASGTAPSNYSPAGAYFRVDASAPEPGTMALAAIGLVPVAGLLRRRRR